MKIKITKSQAEGIRSRVHAREFAAQLEMSYLAAILDGHNAKLREVYRLICEDGKFYIEMIESSS